MNDKNQETHLNFEENFHKESTREHRKEKKRITQRDRSKYKKSDIDQIKKRALAPPDDPRLLQGRVLGIGGDGFVVDAKDHIYLCQLKGSLKREKNQVKNLVVIGDFVLIDPKNEEEGVITYVEERRSFLSRVDSLSGKKEHLIAVNIDQVLITCCVILPALKPYLIDRYIIAAKKGNMDPVIVINKIDCFDNPPDFVDKAILDEEKELFETVMATYQKLGIPCIALSAKTGEGLDALKALMRGKTSVFSGQSGSGKTSLINATQGTSLLVGKVIQKTSKGSHTTTHSLLLPLDEGGFCIDTPGIRSFGIWDLDVEELQEYFHEINALRERCKYPNCMHIDEPECAVKEAVEKGEISPLRFASYCALMTSIKEKIRRR